MGLLKGTGTAVCPSGPGLNQGSALWELQIGRKVDPCGSINASVVGRRKSGSEDCRQAVLWQSVGSRAVPGLSSPVHRWGVWGEPSWLWESRE